MDELLAAVADCDTETIAECLDAGADLHHVGLIHEAVSTDDMQVVTLLLGRVALVDLGAAREKRRHDLQIVRRHTLVDQARAREVGTRVEAGLDLLQVAIVDRGEQVLHKLRRRRRHDGLAAQPARDEPASRCWSAVTAVVSRIIPVDPGT